MSEDTVNRTNGTDEINATVIEIKNDSLHERIIDESLFSSDSASLIGIFIAVAAVLITIGEWPYGFEDSVLALIFIWC